MDPKKRLLHRKKDLEETLKSMQESAKPVDLNEPIGRLSRMDAMAQQQMALNAKKQVETNLRLVDAALKRVEDGSYGYCLECDEEISDKRLQAKPEAAFCTNCQK